MEAEQAELLRQVRRDIHQLEMNRSRSRKEDDRLLSYRGQLAQIETQMRLGSETKFIHEGVKDAPYRALYREFKQRVEQVGSTKFPEVNGRTLYGRVYVLATLLADGRVQKVEITAASSQELANATERLIKDLAPYKLPPIGKYNTVVIGAVFRYVAESDVGERTRDDK